MRTRWIVSPEVDLIVGCAAWSLPLLLVTYPFAAAGEGRRYDEAYAHYRQMFTRVEPDAASLMNFGVLCRLLERHDEAEKSFVMALQKNPSYEAVIRQLRQIR